MPHQGTTTNCVVHRTTPRVGALCLLAGLLSLALHAQANDPVAPRFIDETLSAGLNIRVEGGDDTIAGAGVATFDCDGSGLPSVYITAGRSKAKFFRNHSTRGGPIQLAEERSGLETTNATGAYPIDMDGDGLIDLVVLRIGQVEVYRGVGQCKFELANALWHMPEINDWHTAFSATWEKGRQWPTLAIASYVDRAYPDFPWGHCTPGLLLRPDAQDRGIGPPVLLQPGHCALSMLFSDWNRTGQADLRISNDREVYKGGQEQLWRIAPGEPPREYTVQEGWQPLQIWGMGIASHDVDGDGYPDYFLSSMGDNKFQRLKAHDGRPTYQDQAYKLGLIAAAPYAGGDKRPSTAWHAQFADANNDGLVDLFIAKGNVFSMPNFAQLDPNNLLLQRSDGHFVEGGQEAGIGGYKRARGAMLADLNGDGLLDLIVANRLDRAQLWRNVGTGTAKAPQAMGHWLQLRLQQNEANRYAIGAWVELDLGGRTIRQELTIGGGHASGNLGWMHFGLGQAASARMRVQWPHGPWSDWVEVQADRFYVMDRAQGLRAWSAP